MNKKLLEELEKLWEKNPKLRFGQLLEAFVFKPNEMFYQTDVVTMTRIGIGKVIPKAKQLHEKLEESLEDGNS